MGEHDSSSSKSRRGERGRVLLFRSSFKVVALTSLLCLFISICKMDMIPTKNKDDHKSWNLINEKEKLMVENWREKRLKATFNPYLEFIAYTFKLDILKSFLQNVNLMVFIHVFISLLSVYIFQTYNISFECNVAFIVSPIVFPLAFSINSDFQRREKVLEDLACFKSAGMSWFFCMREWKNPAQLESDWIRDVHQKLKNVLYYLSEYLLTEKQAHRKVILRAIYENFSDAYELVERLRASKLPTNTAIVSKSIHLLHTMGLSFERLRVIRDYRSPRSIRSFNKVFILLLPIILGPYFVQIGLKSNCRWHAYYLAGVLAFVFSTLQCVQDKLDDPFDGMGEDDINFDTIDEWAPILESGSERFSNTSGTLQTFYETKELDTCGSPSVSGGTHHDKKIDTSDSLYTDVHMNLAAYTSDLECVSPREGASDTFGHCDDISIVAAAASY